MLGEPNNSLERTEVATPEAQAFKIWILGRVGEGLTLSCTDAPSKSRPSWRCRQRFRLSASAWTVRIILGEHP